MTGMDYNRKLDLVVSSCGGGSVRIWNTDKKFLREIALPHRADSVCFFNAQGDILISHEKRVSIIQASKYRTSTFDYITERNEQAKLVPVSDELFDEMKKKEMAVREKKDKQVVQKQKATVKEVKI